MSQAFLLKQSVEKKQMLHKINDAVKRAVSEGADSFLLYYSGHGDLNTGGWICSLGDKPCIDIEDSYVTVEEVL